MVGHVIGQPRTSLPYFSFLFSGSRAREIGKAPTRRDKLGHGAQHPLPLHPHTAMLARASAVLLRSDRRAALAAAGVAAAATTSAASRAASTSASAPGGAGIASGVPDEFLKREVSKSWLWNVGLHVPVRARPPCRRGALLCPPAPIAPPDASPLAPSSPLTTNTGRHLRARPHAQPAGHVEHGDQPGQGRRLAHRV